MNVLELFKRITTFVFDVDGVMTDGSVLLLENGLQARTMNVKDGLALQMAMNNGYRVVVISGGSSEPVIRRLEYLGLKDVHLGLKDKLKFFDGIRNEYNLQWDEILYMGDDLPDLSVLEKSWLILLSGRRRCRSANNGKICIGSGRRKGSRAGRN